MNKISVVAENPESTVVAEYQGMKTKQTEYQSEADLEKAFIKQLQNQAYDYLPIHSEKDLIDNLRHQLEKLNDYHFTDKEWDRFFKQEIANPNCGIKEKTKIIQEDYKKVLYYEKPVDNCPFRNILLIDKDNIHNNTLQVINQYETDDGARTNRYDATVLVNGLPLVHIELKRRGVDIKDAFNQINRYQNDSFWAGSGLYEFVQIFVISNGTYTKYYSNTTRQSHISENSGASSKKGKKTSNSFEFTSWWADRKNKPIIDLIDFAKTFFAKHTILNILTKYCVFTSDEMLMVMRPYQIVATESIINKINISSNYKQYGTVDGGGYIWHTTGSGKTLSSFKTAQLAQNMAIIDKVLFVVDRKDLDYQTMKEYDKFEKGAANSNTSTAVLKKQLENSNARIIITTIQKLTCFIKQNKEHPVYNQHIVIIFDECHRSQFGEMHQTITKAFKKYHLFGFTGTPIFAENAYTGCKSDLKTTAQLFGGEPDENGNKVKPLHTYTIVDAIADKNVLPFRIDYISTMKEQENIKDSKVWDINREKALAAPERISRIVSYILEHFNQKTMRNDRSYSYNILTNVADIAKAKNRKDIDEIKQKVRLTGFNSIFAVSSIPFAKLYYEEFRKQMAENPLQKLKVATIFSFGMNGDDNSDDGVFDENPEDTSRLDKSDRDFLESAIDDYNKMFGTSYDTSSDKFQNYYKDVSMRMKNREIDLLIVVNMFLTGFDATTLNTLWVDKNLRMQGLLQAFSRTNRILNAVKAFGNIVCFRNLEEATNKSLALFGDKEAGGIVLLKTFAEYYNGYTDDKGKYVKGYKELIDELKENYPAGELIISEKEKRSFVKLYGAILRLKNILSSFDEFAGKEILSERDVQDYHSQYLRIYDELRPQGKEKDNVNDDLVFEIELIKQVEINIDYILMLIKKYHEGHMEDKEIKVSILKSVDASIELRSKKDLIENFIDSLTPSSNVDEDWKKYVNEQKITELNKIIEEENLNKEETYKYVNNAFKNGYVQENGIQINKVLPPLPIIDPQKRRQKKRETVIQKIIAFFNRFRDISQQLIGE
jgi:type I restriction enzyme R subunit